LNGLAEIFEHYPFGIVERCCDVFDGIASVEKFPPAPCEVRRWCDLYTGAALNVIRRGPPPPEKHYSEKHSAQMREKIGKLFAELVGRLRAGLAAAE
jgi:hypothetical protein